MCHYIQQAVVKVSTVIDSQCLRVCVFLQGGYAAYRYAQPTAATAAAYSDR